MKLNKKDKENLADLLKSPGWKVLDRELREQLNQLRETLDIPGDNNDQFLKGQIFEKKYILDGILQEISDTIVLQ